MYNMENLKNRNADEKDHLQFHLSNIVTVNNLVNVFIDIVSLWVLLKCYYIWLIVL